MLVKLIFAAHWESAIVAESCKDFFIPLKSAPCVTGNLKIINKFFPDGTKMQEIITKIQVKICGKIKIFLPKIICRIKETKKQPSKT